MRLFLYILFVAVCYHVVICGIGSFIEWENMFFNIGEWHPLSRLCYAAVLFAVEFIAITMHINKHRKHNALR